MSEAEHLDRLLRVVVQQEMRKLLLSNTNNMWNLLCQQYFLMYDKSFKNITTEPNNFSFRPMIDDSFVFQKQPIEDAQPIHRY